MLRNKNQLIEERLDMDSNSREYKNLALKKWRRDNPKRQSELNKKHSKLSALRHPEYQAGWSLRKHYGITNEQKTSMVIAQQERCAICGNKFKSTLKTVTY